MPLSSIDELEKKVSRIVQDIISGKITSNTIKNNANIEKYLFENIQDNIEKTTSSNEVISNDVNNQNKQMILFENNKENSEKNNLNEIGIVANKQGCKYRIK